MNRQRTALPPPSDRHWTAIPPPMTRPSTARTPPTNRQAPATRSSPRLPPFLTVIYGDPRRLQPTPPPRHPPLHPARPRAYISP